MIWIKPELDTALNPPKIFNKKFGVLRWGKKEQTVYCILKIIDLKFHQSSKQIMAEKFPKFLSPINISSKWRKLASVGFHASTLKLM